jgi:hypothetical protein
VYITERETKVPSQFNPPPGAYETSDLKMKIGNPHDHTAGVLHSKTKRFVPAKPDIGPGPGEDKNSLIIAQIHLLLPIFTYSSTHTFSSDIMSITHHYHII